LGPWADVIVSVAAIAGIFFVVMGFRGLVETIEGHSGRCCECGRASMLPPPASSHECWRCHRGHLRVLQFRH